jgi:hypothetical protein
MARLVKYVNFQGIKVPEGDDHRYYDWNLSTPLKLVELQGINGESGFRIGTSLIYFMLDFVVMPSGRALFEVKKSKNKKVPNRLDYYHKEDVYNLHYPDQVMEAAFYLIDKALNGLNELKIAHDSHYYQADAWHFLRAVGRSFQIAPYCAMTVEELRHGRKL